MLHLVRKALLLKEILVITDIESTRKTFESHFGDKYNVSFFQSESSAIENNPESFFDYIFIDLIFLKKFDKTPLTKEHFNETFLPLQKHFPEAKKVIMAERRLVQDCVLAVKLGIDSYINYPLVVEEIQYVMDLIYERIKSHAIIEHLEKNSYKPDKLDLLESQSSSMQLIVEKIKSVAETKSTVLLTGESGTGKSVFARKIHDLSNRKNKNFISVHCGAIAENLIESELFGHEKGSFTGAIKKKLGKFELANGGTIFLDEIGTLSEATQIRLLQVLQERFIQRVGGEGNIDIDIRIIAATNSNLQNQIKQKTFREDLYYRLNVFQIKIPPLRQRCEDIEGLSKAILNRFNILYGKDIHTLDLDVLLAFKHYSWPGNIRELENLIERAYVLEKTHVLTADHFSKEIFKESNIPKAIITLFPSLNLSEARRKALEAFERNYIQELLSKSNGSLKEAAIISGVSIRQLHKFIAKHEINRKEFISTNLQ